MNSLRNLVKTAPVSFRAVSTTACKRRDFETFKRLQKELQVDQSIPIFLRKGASDRVIFSLLSLAVSVSLVYSAYCVHGMIFPPPPK